MLTKSTLRGGILLLSVIAVPAGLAETLCVDPADAECHATIQSAVDAASPGDVILIAPHPDGIGYRENIVIDKADLTLRGDTIAPTANILEQSCPQVVLDGCEAPEITGAPCGSIVIDVTAANASIERILLRHGQIRFGVGAEGSALREACIVGNASRAITSAFDVDEWGNVEYNNPVHNLTVEDSIFQGGRSFSVRFLGDNAEIRNNQFYAIDNGVRIDGNGTQITGNTMRVCNDDCVRVVGDNTVADGNRLIGGDDGLYIHGNNPTVINNIVEHMADRNIDVSCSDPCTGGLVKGNRAISNVDDDRLIRIGGQGLTGAVSFIIEDNFLALSSEHGLQFDGQNSIIRRNTIHRAGTESIGEACLYVSGPGANLIEDNVLNLCSFNGILQDAGINNTYRNNIITGSGRGGILIRIGSENTVLDGNQVSGSNGEGIANHGANTSLVNNVLSGNRIDICNEGTIGSFSGNQFDTGGTETACEVELVD